MRYKANIIIFEVNVNKEVQKMQRILEIHGKLKWNETTQC